MLDLKVVEASAAATFWNIEQDAPELTSLRPRSPCIMVQASREGQYSDKKDKLDMSNT